MSKEAIYLSFGSKESRHTNILCLYIALSPLGRNPARRGSDLVAERLWERSNVSVSTLLQSETYIFCFLMMRRVDRLREHQQLVSMSMSSSFQLFSFHFSILVFKFEER